MTENTEKYSRNNKNLIIAPLTKREFANLIDMLIFVGIALLMAKLGDLSTTTKVSIILIYVLIYLPISYIIGATIGQLIMHLRVRKISDFSKNISLWEAYKRVVLVIINHTIGLPMLFFQRKLLHDIFSKTVTVEINLESNDELFKYYLKRIALIKTIFVSIIYILWVIWVENYWLLLGLFIVIDIYYTKKIPWDYWKKPKNGKKPSAVVEWVDAIVFALVAVYMINIFLFQNYKIPTPSLEKSLLVGDHLFVSKVSFGPRIPNTPLSFPLVQNTIPGTTIKSYFEWPHWDYKRLKGFGEVEKGDIVVFNFPTGDTIPFLVQNPDIYNLSRSLGINYVARNRSILKNKKFSSIWERDQFLKSIGRRIIENDPGTYGKIMYRPVDKRENYVKRCVAIAGDTLEIRHNQIYINNKIQKDPENVEYNYHIITNGSHLNDEFFEKCSISNKDRMSGGSAPNYYLPIMAKLIDEIKNTPNITMIQRDEQMPDSSGFSVFPYSPDYPWSRDNYGPLWIPKKGETVDLNIKNLMIYDRIITAYEGNELSVKDKQIYINGELATSYTFKMNYYFMMGDNRQESADSRYWGFVPEDHVVGKPLLVWLSLDEDKGSFPFNIRWNRFFKWVASE